ncbi:TD and POZ domain-containing protein 3 [Caerostris extrusa]|uniref:TD and POZ domain-containing protein 3 n=1 Tax=Caerostris extrusa TaxID=172846 RepID=A0AAV4N6L0_CAEEX|nr:TD and POZ domain-containing protein 3 [Caerostris extrusa]
MDKSIQEIPTKKFPPPSIVPKADIKGMEHHSLKSDLAWLYSTGALTDTKLVASTHTFFAHSQILGARSLVFRAMFSTDMEERSTKTVHISDLDSQTVSRMLVFMYTDILEDVEWERACDLYYAADKYDIRSLKFRCLCFLKKNLSDSNACKTLILADRHRDKDLEMTAQEYILMSKKIILSDEWKDLMESNLQLAARTMYLNWKIF